MASASLGPARSGNIAFGPDFIGRIIAPIRRVDARFAMLPLAALAAIGATVFAYYYLPPPVWGGMAALLVAAPAGWVARIALAKSRAEASSAAKTRLLNAATDDLRHRLRSIARAGAAIDRDRLDPEGRDGMARMRLSARAMLTQLDDIRDCLDIEDGRFAPETRSFDLYRLVNGVVAALRPEAAERGIDLVLRIDPLLPFELRGWPRQLRQVLLGLLTHAIQRAPPCRLRVTLDAAGLTAHRVLLRIALAAPRDAAAIPPDMGVVTRLVGLMGGTIGADHDGFEVELPFAVEEPAAALPLDLAHLPVLIVAKDQEFVGELIEPLETWRAEPRWIGAGDAAFEYLAAFDPSGRRPLLVIDGRGEVMAALSLAHRAAGLPSRQPPYLLFVADEARLDGIVGLADGEFDGILPAPFTPASLRRVLHAMRIEPADWYLAEPAPPAPIAAPVAPPRIVPDIAAEPAPPAVVTEIASHPRYAGEAVPAVDAQALEALWTLGKGPAFFADLVTAFRADSGRIAADIRRAAEVGDARVFVLAAQELRRCCANLGAGRLHELLQSLRDLAPAALLRQRDDWVQRIEAELARIDTALAEYQQGLG